MSPPPDLPKSVLLALGLVACPGDVVRPCLNMADPGQTTDDDTPDPIEDPVGPCLEMMPVDEEPDEADPEETETDEAETDEAEPDEVQLEEIDDASTGPCLMLPPPEAVDEEEPEATPCLSPPKGHLGPCLKVAPPPEPEDDEPEADEPEPDKAPDDAQGVLERVLDRDVLPPDVVERLRRS